MSRLPSLLETLTRGSDAACCASRALRRFDSALAPIVAIAALAIVIHEWRRPLRQRALSPQKTTRRLLRNALFGLPALGTARLVMLPIPLLVACALKKRGWGALNAVPLTQPIKIALGVLFLDWAYYWWHVATHRVPLLWRFHNVHHSDLDMDVTTAARFHFLDLLLSTLYRAGVVVVGGLSPASVVAFEALFNLAVTFHHSNWHLPIALERRLARVIVTPRLHGIHHSIVRAETDSNWSNIFSWWDRWHGTYRDDVAQDDITIGVPAHRDESEMTVRDLFLMPFRPQRAWQLPDGTVPTREKESATDLAE